MRACQQCGKEFVPGKWSTGVFCSQHCTGKSKNKRVEVECSRCGKKFEKPPCNVNENRNFCSWKCFRVKRLQFKCEKCGKVFERPEWYLKPRQNSAKFCSRECANLGSFRKGSQAKDMMKKCSSCGENKHVTFFRKNKSASDGYQGQCTLCQEEKRCQRKYGLSSKYRENKSCQICGVSNQRLVIDHDHKTGKVRGILCSRHNSALGLFDDNIENLGKAISYLQKNER